MPPESTINIYYYYGIRRFSHLYMKNNQPLSYNTLKLHQMTMSHNALPYLSLTNQCSINKW